MEQTVRITALEPRRRSPDIIEVRLEGAPRLVLPAEVVLGAGLRVGDEIDAAQLAALQEREREAQARQAALNLLAYRPRSAAELLQRLREKGHAEADARAAVERMDALGLIDDTRFAESYVRDRVRLRPHGKRRLQQELRRKGVDPETAGEVIGEVLEGEGVSELDLARRAAAKWRPRSGEEPAAARRRLLGFLARRGFGGDAVAAVLAERLGAGDALD